MATTSLMSPGAGPGSKSDNQVKYLASLIKIPHCMLSYFDSLWQISGAPTMMDKLSNYIIVDIGANLTNKKFSRDLDAVIQRAREAGVTKIMVR